jgi:hypothetical protein
MRDGASFGFCTVLPVDKVTRVPEFKADITEACYLL